MATHSTDNRRPGVAASTAAPAKGQARRKEEPVELVADTPSEPNRLNWDHYAESRLHDFVHRA